MTSHITKQQIIDWLTNLIDAGEPPDHVIQALAAIQDFTTWWQKAQDRAWDPRLWTPEDEEAYQQILASSFSTMARRSGCVTQLRRSSANTTGIPHTVPGETLGDFLFSCGFFS